MDRERLKDLVGFTQKLHNECIILTAKAELVYQNALGMLLELEAERIRNERSEKDTEELGK